MQHLRKNCTRAKERINVKILFAPHLLVSPRRPGAGIGNKKGLKG
jgi:hypothetical protein